MHKLGMLVILETQCDPNKLRKTFSKMGFNGFLSTEVNGYAKGIATVWKEDSMYITFV